MKPRIISTIFACLAIVLAAVSTPTSNAHAAAKKWRIQTALPAASMYMDIIKSFAANVDAMSGGRLKTEVLPVGAVVGFFDVQDAVDKGLVEGGFTWPHFFSGKKPAAYLFADQPSVGGMDQFTFLSWYYEGDGEKLYADFIKNDLKANMVGFINLMSGGQPLGWFKEPIKNLEDFRKLKYRSPPGITGELFNNMGVTTVSLPGGELVPSAQRGVIDAAEWINPGEDIRLGMHQVWKHYYLQGMHQASDLGTIIINGDFWKALSPDLQKIIEVAAKASVSDSIAVNIKRNGEAIHELKTKHDVIIHDTPADLYPAFAASSAKVMKDYSAKDAFFKKVADSQKAFAKNTVPYWTKLLGLYHSIGQAAQE
jgi:TRAP-type mannitol/chloroaromatic compound transport system substrate-binding protein